jgi:hypothetical protein
LPTSDLFSKEIIEIIKSAEEPIITKPVKVNQTEKENELVFFFKPELLEVKDHEKILCSLGLVEQKFSEYNVTVNGAAIVPGSVLKEHEIMSRHYGFINQLSRKASKMVDDDNRREIFQQLDVSDPEDYQILGGHEFLEYFDADIESLSEIWFSQKAGKLRSGFYFSPGAFKGQKIVLVNGFHPSQIEHFTREDHRIYLMLLHTDTDWTSLKFDLVGDTFPENANHSSIRGSLFANPQKYGQREVGINTNGVHLSAGPFEAAFEVVNFFGDLIELDPKETPPLAIQQAMKSGFTKDQALKLLDNPVLNESDLFSKTENLNTHEAIGFAKQALVL